MSPVEWGELCGFYVLLPLYSAAFQLVSVTVNSLFIEENFHQLFHV